MPPIHRYAQPGTTVRIPSDVPDAARWVMDEDWLDGTWCGGESADDIFGRLTIRALRSMRPNNHGDLLGVAPTMVRVSAHWLCLVRNLLDIETLNGEPECDEMVEQNPGLVTLDDDGNCLECHWCKCLVLRDRMDYWLDKAGYPKNAYLAGITYDVEAVWRKVVA